MALIKVIEYPAEVLSQPGAPVEEFGEELIKLTSDMFETMYTSRGVGLAAPQVNLSLRLFVMDCEGVKLVAANPEIILAEGVQSGHEGCLSIGKVHAPLVRSERVVLRAQDINGQIFEREGTGFIARCFLHETDHCDGILFIDRLSPLNRSIVKNRFKKLKKLNGSDNDNNYPSFR
jgi:peptide deformylase